MAGNWDDQYEEDGAERVYRELFSPEEARHYAQPERYQLPTHRIAVWSVGVSLVFAGILVISWFVERPRSAQRLNPARRTNKNVPLGGSKRNETDTASYIR